MMMIPVSDVTSIGRVAREARKAQGLTQRQLALVCGVGERFVVELEGGKETVRLGMALKVLEALGVRLLAASENAPPEGR